MQSISIREERLVFFSDSLQKKIPVVPRHHVRIAAFRCRRVQRRSRITEAINRKRPKSSEFLSRSSCGFISLFLLQRTLGARDDRTYSSCTIKMDEEDEENTLDKNDDMTN
ncbi:unnamed protein product [Nezara viridula]|uniref:Uncharacterized protein n=1 Tax=Nezara viridula TaxID=85310 RepID=A0A9P0MS20_NEZVI|nr:unnamed protein product [Nezara viridula]